jgi:hypothetical protein
MCTHTYMCGHGRACMHAWLQLWVCMCWHDCASVCMQMWAYCSSYVNINLGTKALMCTPTSVWYLWVPAWSRSRVHTRACMHDLAYVYIHLWAQSNFVWSDWETLLVVLHSHPKQQHKHTAKCLLSLAEGILSPSVVHAYDHKEHSREVDTRSTVAAPGDRTLM